MGAAASDGDCALDVTSAGQLQCATTGIVQALTSATDATPSRFAASDLPLYQARDMLEVVERALSAFEGNFVASAPARSDLMATAELAGELLAIFGAVAQQVHPDARRADGTTQIH